MPRAARSGRMSWPRAAAVSRSVRVVLMQASGTRAISAEDNPWLCLLGFDRSSALGQDGQEDARGGEHRLPRRLRERHMLEAEHREAAVVAARERHPEPVAGGEAVRRGD